MKHHLLPPLGGARRKVSQAEGALSGRPCVQMRFQQFDGAVFFPVSPELTGDPPAPHCTRPAASASARLPADDITQSARPARPLSDELETRLRAASLFHRHCLFTSQKQTRPAWFRSASPGLSLGDHPIWLIFMIT